VPVKNEDGSFTAILVSDSPDKLADVDVVLKESGIAAFNAPDPSAAMRRAKSHPPDFVLATRDLPGSSGPKLISRIRHRFPLILGAVFGPQLPLDERRSIIAQGADDYIETGADVSRIHAGIGRLVARKEIGLFGRSPKILQAIEIVEGIAPTKVTVLVTGESGTGKELIARAVHRRSKRKDGPFVAVNCAALPQGVLESELFGHEKGSFTGATAQRKGRFEVADGGTLLLDEVGEMPAGTQAKLLRVLEEERFMRVGGSQTVEVDVRVIASTNRDLKRLVDEGSFRGDLYYRLNVVPIHVPPLRERREDIRTIFLSIIERSRIENGLKYGGISEDAMTLLENYDWPGNVRELKNLADSLLVLSRGHRIGVDSLPDHIVRAREICRDLPVRVGRPRDEIERDLLFGRLAEIEARIARLTDLILGMRQGTDGTAQVETLPRALPGDAVFREVPADHSEVVLRPGTSIKEAERELIERTLKEVGGNRKKAAELLGIGERTLYRSMKQYKLN
jgi:DNA-binding NtrC family response regulator